MVTVTFTMPDGSERKEEIRFGEFKRIPLAEGQNVKALIEPGKAFDMGEGAGRKLEAEIMGGKGGIILDGRGRPLKIPEDEKTKKEVLLKWFSSLNLYPKERLEKLT